MNILFVNMEWKKQTVEMHVVAMLAVKETKANLNQRNIEWQLQKQLEKKLKKKQD